VSDATIPTSLQVPCAIAPYVPHGRAMCLLDTLLEVDDDHLVAEVTPRASDLFATDDAIPGWVGLEWLAQAVAAWAGVQGAARGEAPSIGFLLGVRRYHSLVSNFPFGRPVRVEITLDFHSANGLGAFLGRLLAEGGQVLASGTLNVFQPESDEVLEAMRQGRAP
jgi:predicted hotdog family 3-hydroxylacyl-ACP dehydratase